MVDPADAIKISEVAEQFNIDIVAILNTHKHDDHVCGNVDLQRMATTKSQLKIAEVPITDQMILDRRQAVRMSSKGDIINVDNFAFQVISTPCHTSGHITFFPTVWTLQFYFQVTLFFSEAVGGFFEGNGADMYNSLNRIKDHQIPGATKIFCGHEYSFSNLAFALSVEPNNNELIRKLKWVIEQRDIDLPTIPSTWEEELSYNPFLRLSVPEIQESVGVLPSDTPENVMSKVRNAKDVYAFETAAVLEKVNSTDIPNVKSIDEDKDFIRDHEPNLEVASYERTTPIVCIMSAENYECNGNHSLINKLSNLGFFTREIVLSSKSTSTKISRKNGAKKSNLTSLALQRWSTRLQILPRQ